MDWRRSLAAKDTAAISTFHTQDAVYSPQGGVAFRGRDSVSARWAREFGIPGFKLERTPIRIDVAKSGDLATEVGTYDVRFQVRNRPQKAAGTYMTAWRKEDGTWRIASYIWNRNEAEGSR
jgi:ketosteroid isomerase-like protein